MCVCDLRLSASSGAALWRAQIAAPASASSPRYCRGRRPPAPSVLSPPAGAAAARRAGGRVGRLSSAPAGPGRAARLRVEAGAAPGRRRHLDLPCAPWPRRGRAVAAPWPAGLALAHPARAGRLVAVTEIRHASPDVGGLCVQVTGEPTRPRPTCLAVTAAPAMLGPRAARGPSLPRLSVTSRY